MNPDLLSRQFVNAALRANLPLVAIACLVLVVGICSLLLARWRSGNRLLLWVGTFSVMYGARLLLQNDLVHAALNGQELYPLVLCLTFVIPVPYALFARELFGRGWHSSIEVWLWAEIAFAFLAIPAVLIAHQIYWANWINGVLIIAGTLLILLHVVAVPKGSDLFAASLKWPLGVFTLCVLLTNQGFRLAGFDIEPIGFVVLLVGLCAIAARYALASEEKLVEVEGELAAARKIQSAIIPDSAPALPSLRLATRYQPMTSVAGDFYDFLKTSEHHLTILIADVSGHGVPAALVASMLKVSFAAQREQARNPAGVLAGLNGMLRGSLGGQYVTAACAAIDLESRTITYAGAGHPSSLLLQRAVRNVVQLSENGLFIGPFPNAAYQNITVQFESGDKLLLYTDGITEATGPDGEEFGLQKLEQFLRDTEDLEPAEFVKQLFAKISTAPQQQDDLTVVLTQFL